MDAVVLKGCGCFERARLHIMLRNSNCGTVLKGHGFSRAAVANFWDEGYGL
jgi:hypothetical protein